MATHLNTDPMKINHVIDNTGLQQQQQHHQQQPQQLQQQPQLQLQPRQGQQQHIELQPGKKMLSNRCFKNCYFLKAFSLKENYF